MMFARRETLVSVGMAMLPALIACGPQSGTDVGNGASVSLELSAYEQPAPTSLELEDGVTVSSVYMVVDRVRLVPGASCEGDDEIDVDGPFVANLLTGDTLGGALSFSTAGNRFCKLRIGYHRLKAEAAPAGSPEELVDHSILIQGSRADNVPFRISSRRDDRLELRSTDSIGFQLPSGNNLLFLGYDVGAWVQAVDLSSLGGDPIVVDEATNSERLELFDAAVEASARLFKDTDDDGVLDLEEQMAPLAE